MIIMPETRTYKKRKQTFIILGSVKSMLYLVYFVKRLNFTGPTVARFAYAKSDLSDHYLL